MSGFAQRLTTTNPKNVQSVEIMKNEQQLPAEAIQPAESANIMGEVRGNAIQPNVGTVEYCLKKAKETVHCVNRSYKKSMGMMEPTLAQLTATNERAAVTLSRLKSLPFDEQREMAKAIGNWMEKAAGNWTEKTTGNWPLN